MSLELIPSTMPYIVEEDVWSEASEGKEENEIEAINNYEERVEEPQVGMTFDTPDEAYMYYSRYAKQKGFDVAKRTSRKGKDGKLKDIGLSCSRAGKARVTTSNPVKLRPQSKIECQAHITVVMHRDGKWVLNRVTLEHNHEYSPGNARFFKSNRILDQDAKRKLDLNDKAGIRLHKTFDSIQIEAGGPDKVPYLEKDCRNYMDKLRRLRLVEGDADVMHRYFMRMKADNSDFFYALDLNEKGRLRNVFWADARSRAACKEFGDVVTFDTTYLVNKYDMPFAPFVGVNHHGKSILLGCGLISHEDTESFMWLFNTWKICMWGRAPNAIITDQCMAMKNAIENVFPDTRHRWCIWHIMKKVPEKLSGYKKYDSISWCLRHAVHESLSIQEFEDAWQECITNYELKSNTWLHGLYLEKNRWVPAYVKDIFWAGMSSTQRSEGMNAYFDGYIHSKTTLKQFVEQYENALAKKVENEKLDDMKSWSSYIPCIDPDDELEKQFQSVYTHDKVREFHKEFAGKLKCNWYLKGENDILSEYEVKEWVTFGEGEEKMRKRVSFTVNFNAETNEAHCNCRLFKFKGMVCRHQLMVFNERGIERVHGMYILRRWCKNVKRIHTKVRIKYDNSSMTIEARRHDNMCNLFNEITDLAEDFQEKYDMVMTRGRKLKQDLLEVSVICESNMVHDSIPCSKQSTNILDPKVLRRKGRPPTKRKQGFVEKVVGKQKRKNYPMQKTR
ncbi:hypothetical protein OROGR_017221 [Orobanche gracilis]